MTGFDLGADDYQPVVGPEPTDADLLRLYPTIPWGESLTVQVPGVGRGMACRFCIARHGLKGSDVAALPQTPDEWLAHMQTEHASVAAAKRTESGSGSKHRPVREAASTERTHGKTDVG